jgi:cytochrome c oxidase assembly factor CtaG
VNQPAALLPLAVFLLCLAFWAAMAWHMIRNSRLADGEKMNWAVAFIFFSVFAAAWYYYTEYRRG